MNKKILLISWGTGGAEALNQVYFSLKEEIKDFDIKNISISKFASNKLNDYIEIDEDKILDFVKEENPTLVINERSNGLKQQNSITKFCSFNGINNIAILDLYGNYKERFTNVPNMILVPSKSIEKDMIMLGFDKSKLIVTGNPTFDRLKNYKYKKDSSQKKKILFTSQPLQNLEEYCISQYNVFDDFYKILPKNKVNQIVVRLHPMEDKCIWDEFIKKYQNVTISPFNKADDILEICTNYDLIIGYNSTVQLQASMLGIPTISYELSSDYKKQISDYFAGYEVECMKYSDFKENATDNVINVIKNYLKCIIYKL